MEHFGDITKLNGYSLPPVDVLVGGSPCQDLSVAGLRAGLDGARSGLFMEQVRLCKEMRENDIRNGIPIQYARPKFLIWENVVGAVSSGKPKGEDFRIVLEEISKIRDPKATIPLPKDGKWHTSGSIVGNGWSISWRVHDAQFWGVPQRRRRISLIADFGSESNCNEILFVGKSLSRNTDKSGETRKSSTDDTSYGIGADDCTCLSFQERSGKEGGGKGILVQQDMFGTLTAAQKQYVCYDARGNGDGKTAHSIIGDHENRVTDYSNLVVSCDTGFVDVSKNISPSLRNRDYKDPPCVAYEEPKVAYIDTTHADDVVRMDSIVAPLEARDYKGGKLVAYGFDQGATRDVGAQFFEECSKTITNGSCPGHHTGVVIQEAIGVDCYNITVTGDKAKSITAAATDPCYVPCILKNLQVRYIVRRLTPRECERLQGFPDDWTNIGDYTSTQGKLCKTTDTARYKQLGNSIALPFWGWLLNRITIVLKRDNPNHIPTLGSLFDGIGGFPLLWAKINGVDSCLWASEIEESCIAVTKKHFGDKDHKGDIDNFLPFVRIKDD